MDEILQALKLSKNELEQNPKGDYEYYIEDAGEFSRLYNRLDKSSAVEEDPDLSALTVGRSTITFTGAGYNVILQSDFDSDVYTLIIREE